MVKRLTFNQVGLAIALVMVWGFGFGTGYESYPALNPIIECDTDSDCEEKNPHMVDWPTAEPGSWRDRKTY